MKFMHTTIQKAILNEIDRPQFSAALPPLSDESWINILGTHPGVHAENDRLEFLGDALMYATLGIQLYRQLPQASPGLYTNVRAALHSNVTFSRLAEKLDIFAVNDTVLKALTAKTFGEGTKAPSKSRPEIKATADLFETVIGRYCLDRGFESLCQWVDELYNPLVSVASRTYLECRGNKLGKRTRTSTSGSPSRPLRKLKQVRSRATARSPNRKNYHIPVTPHKALRPKKPASHRSSLKASKQQSPPEIIDLTLEEEDNTLIDVDDLDNIPVVCQRCPSVQSPVTMHKAGAFVAVIAESGSLASPGAPDDTAAELELENMSWRQSNSAMDVDAPSDSESVTDDDSDSSHSVMLFVVG